MIRPMQSSDIITVLDIEKCSFSTPWTQESFEQEMTNPRAHYVVLEEKTTVIGYGGFWQILEEGHITNLAIHPDYRGKGHGKKLIETMLNYARSLNIERVTLEVRKSNEIALKAYTSLGFNIEGKRSRYYTNPTEDAYIMWVSL